MIHSSTTYNLYPSESFLDSGSSRSSNSQLPTSSESQRGSTETPATTHSFSSFHCPKDLKYNAPHPGDSGNARLSRFSSSFGSTLDNPQRETPYTYLSDDPTGHVVPPHHQSRPSTHSETYTQLSHLSSGHSSAHDRSSCYSTRTSTTTMTVPTLNNTYKAYELHDGYLPPSTYHPSSSCIGTVSLSSGIPSTLNRPNSLSQVSESFSARSGLDRHSSVSSFGEQALPETFALSPLLRPNPPVIFDVTRSLRSIRTDSSSRAIGIMSDSATSPPIQSSYLVLTFSLPGLPIEADLLQTLVVSLSHHGVHGRILSVWDVYSAISVFLGGEIPKDALMRLLQASNGKESQRAERRGRADVCWIDLVKDGTLFFGLRIVGIRRAKLSWKTFTGKWTDDSDGTAADGVDL